VGAALRSPPRPQRVKSILRPKIGRLIQLVPGVIQNEATFEKIDALFEKIDALFEKIDALFGEAGRA
jgi:hypothetical protein